MESVPFWEKLLVYIAPFGPFLKGAQSLSPFIAACILGFLAFVLIKGYRRYDLVRRETEQLLRRYIVFRGKKHSLLRGTRRKKDTEEILRSISRSWGNFKEYLSQKTDLQRENYRWMKKGIVVGAVLLVVNTVRQGLTGLIVVGLPSGFFSSLSRDLPHYLLPIVGLVMLRVQRKAVKARASGQLDPALEVLLTDFDREDPGLYEEFDPLDEEGEK